MKSLTDKGFKAIGTIRDSRTKKAPLMSNKEMKEKKRGEFDYRGDGNVVLARRNDNSVVTAISNWATPFPLQTVGRYSSKNKQKISVQISKIISLYNTDIGGVDLLDRLLRSYRPKIRCKKWWWNLFSNGLNTIVIAAWSLHCQTNGKNCMTHLEFKREISTVAMKVGLESFRSRKEGPTSSLINDVVSYGTNHFLVSATQGKWYLCKKNTTKQCEMCNKRYHPKCFAVHHKN